MRATDAQRQTRCQSPRLTVSGRVCGLRRHWRTFITTIVQSITQFGPFAPLTIRAAMGVHAACQRPYHRLPGIDSVVSFTGELIEVEEGVAIVIVDNVAYLPRSDPLSPI